MTVFFLLLLFFPPTDTGFANVTGSRKVNFCELDFTLWPVLNQFASGHCLGHICERQNHYNEKSADLLNSVPVVADRLKHDTVCLKQW